MNQIAVDLSRGKGQLSGVTIDINIATRGSSALILGLERERSGSLGDIYIAQEFANSARLTGISAQAVTDHGTTYRELISKGRSNLIRDLELRILLSNYYEQIEQIEEIRSKIPLDIMVRFRELTGTHPSQIQGINDLSDDQKRCLTAETTEDLKVIRKARFLNSILEFAGPSYERAIEENQVLLDKVN